MEALHAHFSNDTLDDVTSNWFELSPSGWRSRATGRPLAALVYEAVQNAFDQRAQRVLVQIDEERIVVEDDCPGGFADPRLAYTLFLTDKHDPTQHRGRYGRGLKELLSVMTEARIETVGFTVVFSSAGRQVIPNHREQGTRLELHRRTPSEEVAACRRRLTMLIPPQGVTVTVNNAAVVPPRRYAILRKVKLPTLFTDGGQERVVVHETTVVLAHPRTAGERPFVFEMGLPVEAFEVPWHVDIHQRIPLGEGRDRLGESYRALLLGVLFESLVATLSPEELTHDWVALASSRCSLSDASLRTYATRLYGPRAVLGHSPAEDDRARQRGAQVIDTQSLSDGQVAALRRVMKTSADTNAARQRAHERVDAAEPYQQRALAFFTVLAKRILGRPVRFRLVRETAGDDGIIESAHFDPKRFEVRINVLGKMNLREPLEPATLGIFFHELAHAYHREHDHRFIAHLEEVAGLGARVLALEGKKLADDAGVPWPE